MKRQTVELERRPQDAWRYPLGPLQIAGTGTGSADTLVTVPDDTTIEIHYLQATNTDSSARDLSIHIIPDGGSIGATNLFLDTLSVAANTTARIDEFLAPGGGGLLLLPGDVVKVFASVTNVVNIVGWGMARR